MAVSLILVIACATMVCVTLALHSEKRLQARWDSYRAKHYPGLSNEEAIRRHGSARW